MEKSYKIVAAEGQRWASLEALIRNVNVSGLRLLLDRGLGEEELEKVMTQMRIPILPEGKRDKLLRSLEAHRREITSQEHFSNNRPVSLKEMLKNR